MFRDKGKSNWRSQWKVQRKIRLYRGLKRLQCRASLITIGFGIHSMGVTHENEGILLVIVQTAMSLRWTPCPVLVSG